MSSQHLARASGALTSWARNSVLATAIFACVVAISLYSQPAHAGAKTRLKAAGGLDVAANADWMFRDSEKQVIELKGNVQIVYEQQYISCDHARINLLTQEVEAYGNLVISSPQAYVEGESALLSYKDNTGVIMQGFVKSGQVIFEGKVVRKTGVSTYEAEDASFTACTTCPTAWTFSGTRIRAEIGGYAYIKNSVLRVADFPVLWLPYLVVPLKSERQTGLLIPSIGFSGNDGFTLQGSYFYAISRSQDATFTVFDYAQRGVKGMMNYRYMLSEQSQGEFNGAYLHDHVFETDPIFSNNPAGSHANRWFLNSKDYYELPNGFTSHVDLNLVGDLRYPRDFPDEVAGQGDPALENRMSLTRNTEHTHSSLDVDYYINQLQTSPIASNSSSVHRWPELQFSLIERPVTEDGPLSGLLFNLKTDYVNFAREDYGYDDVAYTTQTLPNGTTQIVKGIDQTRSINSIGPDGTITRGGAFDPGVDIIRAGQRLDIQPELSYPFALGQYVDVLPDVQARYQQYSFDVSTPAGSGFDPTPYRQFVRTSVSTRMQFSRVYGGSGDDDTLSKPKMFTTLYKHELEPEIVYASVPYLFQSNSPFFGQSTDLPAFLDEQPISDNDFQSGRGVQFDYEDRVTNRDTASFILGNRLMRKTYVDGNPVYKQVARWRLAQSYDFAEARKENQAKYPWSDVSSLLDLRFENIETNTLVRYYPYHNKANTSSRLRIMDSRGRFFQLNFTQTYLITRRPEDAYSGRTEDIGYSFGFQSKYIGLAGGIDYDPQGWSPINFLVKSWSIKMNLKPPGNCWGIRTSFSQSIGSVLGYHIDFDYNFGGQSS